MTGGLEVPTASLSVPNRFFDVVTASYYVTDNFKLSIGHRYIFDRNALALGGEHGFALGGGRMAALFTEGTLGEHGTYSALAGLRIYFGQRDKSLMDRHRQDDPTDYLGGGGGGIGMGGAIYNLGHLQLH